MSNEHICLPPFTNHRLGEVLYITKQLVLYLSKSSSWLMLLLQIKSEMAKQDNDVSVWQLLNKRSGRGQHNKSNLRRGDVGTTDVIKTDA